MYTQLENQLLKILKKELPTDDPSHDVQHVLRVLHNAKIIAGTEGADLS